LICVNRELSASTLYGKEVSALARLLANSRVAVLKTILVSTVLAALVAQSQAQWFFNPATGHEYRITNIAYWGISDTSTRTFPDWWDAEAEAVADGGHLVTINDAAENNWLVGTFGTGSLYIGLTDWGSEGSFYWISGEPVTYLNWDVGQPDNAHAGGEDATHINHWTNAGYWNDLGAQGNAPAHPSYRGIIERTVVPEPTTIFALLAGGLAVFAVRRRR
jgi:hypothetical protein